MEKGALSLLSQYGTDDNSDEEIPVGRVSVKRCHREDDKNNTKRSVIKRLPLPPILLENHLDNSADDSSLHEGRIRSFPHERGNWATYVYIPYEPPDISIANVITLITNSMPQLNFQAINHFHISLTKTIILKHHWINSFMQSIREKVAHTKKFVTVFESLNVYCNEERTRTFVGLQIRSGYDTLVKLVEQLDVCLNEFRLPLFYENPSFHMSLSWCLGDHEEEIKKILPGLNSHIERMLQSSPQDIWYNYITHLECKCGNKLFTFNLE